MFARQWYSAVTNARADETLQEDQSFTRVRSIIRERALALPHVGRRECPDREQISPTMEAFRLLGQHDLQRTDELPGHGVEELLNDLPLRSVRVACLAKNQTKVVRSPVVERTSRAHQQKGGDDLLERICRAELHTAQSIEPSIVPVLILLENRAIELELRLEVIHDEWQADAGLLSDVTHRGAIVAFVREYRLRSAKDIVPPTWPAHESYSVSRTDVEFPAPLPGVGGRAYSARMEQRRLNRNEAEQYAANLLDWWRPKLSSLNEAIEDGREQFWPELLAIELAAHPAEMLPGLQSLALRRAARLPRHGKAYRLLAAAIALALKHDTGDSASTGARGTGTGIAAGIPLAHVSDGEWAQLWLRKHRTLVFEAGAVPAASADPTTVDAWVDFLRNSFEDPTSSRLQTLKNLCDALAARDAAAAASLRLVCRAASPHSGFTYV